MRKKYYKMQSYFSTEKKLFLLISFSYVRIIYQYLQIFLIYKKLFYLIYPILQMVLIEHGKSSDGYI